jgi:hypothetical protein
MSQNSQNSGAPTLIAALILGASLIVAALLVRSSVDDTAREIAALKDVLVRPQAANAPT